MADFSRVVAGPNVAMILGDLGADVIKVERPGGGDDTRSWGPPWEPHTPGTAEDAPPTSTYFLAINRNKRSVTLDLNDVGDAELARRLVQRSDVMVENFLPGTLEKFGLDWTSLTTIAPRIVLCSIQGYGDTAGAARLPGYDLLAQAASGLMHITGDPDGPPTKVGVAVVDVLASLYATIGVLAALDERHITGRGRHVKVSLLDAALASLINQGSTHLVAGGDPIRQGNDHPSITPYSTYAAADRPFVIACGNDVQFVRLARAIDQPGLADDVRFATNAARVEHRDALRVHLEDALSVGSAGEWIARLTDAGVPAGPINTIAEAFAFSRALGLAPDTAARRTDGSEVATTRSPIRFAGDAALTATPPSRVRADRPPPRLGEHDEEIRAWLSEP